MSARAWFLSVFIVCTLMLLLTLSARAGSVTISFIDAEADRAVSVTGDQSNRINQAWIAATQALDVAENIPAPSDPTRLRSPYDANIWVEWSGCTGTVYQVSATDWFVNISADFSLPDGTRWPGLPVAPYPYLSGQWNCYADLGMIFLRAPSPNDWYWTAPSEDLPAVLTSTVEGCTGYALITHTNILGRILPTDDLAAHKLDRSNGAATNLTLIGTSTYNGTELSALGLSASSVSNTVSVLAPTNNPAFSGALSFNGSGIWYVLYSVTNSLGKTTSNIETNTAGGASRTAFFSQGGLYRTGETNAYLAGCDGYYRSGLAWPNPRFLVGAAGVATNTVVDYTSNLMWARNAAITGGLDFAQAIAWAEGMTYGGYSDWRVPNIVEMNSLVVHFCNNPHLANTAGTGQWTQGNPFHNALTWRHQMTSTTYAGSTNSSPRVDVLYGGLPILVTKQTTSGGYAAGVWLVRGGQ